MKKLLLLVPFLLLNTGHAQSEGTSCIQVIQSAISPTGQCQTFPTPCDVPSDYKVVPSCNIVKDKNFGRKLEDRMNHRSLRVRKTRRPKNIQKRHRSFGRSAGAGSRRDRITRTRADYNKRGTRKTSTRKNYSAAARNRIKYLNRNLRGGYQHPDKPSREERLARRQTVHKIRSRVQKNLHQKLSNTPSWSSEINRRSRAVRPLRSWNNSHLSEKRRKMRSARKKRIYEGIKLRKTWKGQRIEGSLE